MTDTNLLVDKILSIQQDRTKNIEEKTSSVNTLLYQNNISELQNTIKLTSLNDKIQKLEKNNQLLQQKINQKSNFSSAIQNTYRRIRTLQTEIEDLTKLKSDSQKEHLDEEKKVSETWQQEKQIWHQKTNLILQEKTEILTHKQNLHQEYTKLQEKQHHTYQDIQQKLDSLQLEFKMLSNLRCSHRNQNLTNIIKFQQEYKKIIPRIKKLKQLRQQKQDEMLEVMDTRKKTFHTLLTQHLQILQTNNQNTSPDEKLYYECIREQKTFERESKNTKNNFLKEIQILEQHIQQQEASYAEIQLKQDRKQETHEHTLSKIRELKKIRHQKHQELELQQLKILNQINIWDEKLNLLDIQQERINASKQDLKKKLLTVETYIPVILENHLQIQLKKHEVSLYQKQIDNMRSRQLQMINIYQSEIEVNNQKIKELTNSKKKNSHHQKLISLRKKMIIQQNRLEKEKHIKDNNKKILQELDTLSKIIT